MTEENKKEVEKKDTQKKGLSRDELANLIKTISSETMAPMIEEAMKPLNEKSANAPDLLIRKEPELKKVDPAKKGIGAARFVRALAFGRGDPERATFFANKAWDDDLGDSVKKSLQAGDFTAGGALIPPEFAAEIIELLRSRSIIRSAGARVLPMNSGTLTLRRQTAGSSATYVGESRDITKTEPTVGQLVLTAKKLAAIVPLSNDLLMFDSGDLADEFVRDDLVQEIAIREDQAFLRDDGLQDKPKGIRHWAAAANVQSTNGTTASNIEDDFKDLINALETNDVRMIRPVWLMNPRSKNHLVNLRDGNGNLIYPEIRGASPTLYGWPVFVSTNVPINLGGGGNETEVYFVDMADAVIGEASMLEIAVDSSASYVESGSLISAFSRDETLIRAISRHDFAMRHDESVALKSDVTWGA